MLYEKLENILNPFNKKMEEVINRLYDKWNKREQEPLDILEFALDVLYFRNTDIFNSINILLRNSEINGAELLLRPLYEGIIIFEWCLIDPQKRVLRFKRTCFEGTVELLDNGYLKGKKYNQKNCKEALNYFETNGYKNIPNRKQMLEELVTFNKNYSYKLYSHLSKITHGIFENWGDFLDYKNNLKIKRKRFSKQRFYACFTLTHVLQMHNIINFAKFDSYMFIDEINSLEKYYLLNVYPILKQFDL